MIIGIAGPARSGKDTAAEYLIKQNPNYRRASFADPIKTMMQTGFGMTHEQLYGDLKETIDPRFGRSPREMMQTLGTEWGRQLVHGDIWVNTMDHYIKPDTIVPDVRFENEAEYIRQRGILVHIVGRERVISDDHISEQALTMSPIDLIIVNDGTLENFYYHLSAISGVL